MSSTGAQLDIDDLAVAGRFPEIRGQLRDEYWYCSDADIEAWVPQTFEGLTAEELENFLRSLRSFGKTAGQTLVKAAPGMLSGAVQGASVGMAAGPYGALIGAGLGAVGGGAAQLATQPSPPGAQPPTAQPAPGVPVTPPPAQRSHPVVAPAIAPAQPAPAPLPSPAAPPPVRHATPTAPPGQAVGAAALAQVGGQAVGTLLQFLSQPQVLQAITALAMQQAGRETVSFGGTDVRTVDVLAEIARLSTAALGESLSHPPHRTIGVAS